MSTGKTASTSSAVGGHVVLNLTLGKLIALVI